MSIPSVRLAFVLGLAWALHVSPAWGEDWISDFAPESHSECENIELAAVEIIARNVGLLRSPASYDPVFSTSSMESRLSNAAWEIGEDGLFRVRSAWSPYDLAETVQPREVVKNTTKFPYCAVCRIEVRQISPGGKGPRTRYGTAFFVGPRLLLTAAHNLVDKEYLGEGPGAYPNVWHADLIHVYPAEDARKKPSLPYGQDIAGDENGPIWTVSSDYDYQATNDYGWIHLPDDSLHRKLPNRFLFELEAWGDARLKERVVYYAGYPGIATDTGDIVMWKSASRIRQVNSDAFYHRMQAEDGASGSPIYVRTSAKNNTWAVVGMHTGDGGLSMRITDEIIRRTRELRRDPTSLPGPAVDR